MMTTTTTMMQGKVAVFLILILCGSNGYALVSPSSSSVHRIRSVRTATSSTRDASRIINGAEPSDAVVEAPTSQPDATSRRQALIKLAGALSATLTIQAANADPSPISSIQGPLQDVIAPGHWIGQFLPLNSKTETWEFASSSPREVSSALVEVINELTQDRRAKLLIPNFKISVADSKHLHVITWTKAEWLDSFDVKLNERNGGGCIATASFYATGFLPTSIPLAPLVNVGMAWLPFGSPGPRGEMLQDFRLRAIRGLLDKKLQG